MSRIWSVMDVGKRSLMNSQTALQTVSHNIANKGTEGFSRQRVEIQSNVPIGEGQTRIGMGSRTGAITRVNNPHLEKQLEREVSQLGEVTAKAEMLSRVEQVYNEQVNKGLNQYMGEFFNSFRELGNNPESLASRTLVKESAANLTRDFSRVHKQLSEIEEDADFQIVNTISQVNQMTKEIAELNEKVSQVEIAGGNANDERDRRDHLVKDLGKMINIRYAESKDGQLAITAGNTALLVSGFSHRDLHASPTPKTKNKAEGGVEIFYRSNEKTSLVNITDQIDGGEIGGLLNVRSGTIHRLKTEADELAYTLASEVNKAHIHGFNRYNRQGNLFFKQPTSSANAAANLEVDEKIKQDVGLVAPAGAGGSPGDNRISNVISSLQYKKTMDGKSTTFDDFYGTIVGKLGVETSRANSAHESQNHAVNQLKKIRESISGVSLDEETTKMIEFQKSFDASARLIRTADEMLDTVINLKRY